MNLITQLRNNANVLLAPHYRTGHIPDAVIAGALRMAADALERFVKREHHPHDCAWDHQAESWEEHMHRLAHQQLALLEKIMTTEAELVVTLNEVAAQAVDDAIPDAPTPVPVA